MDNQTDWGAAVLASAIFLAFLLFGLAGIAAAFVTAVGVATKGAGIP